MDIKNVKDLRTITITRDEYVKLGQINKFLINMPLYFHDVSEFTGYLINEVEVEVKK
tara:strand:+ start:231 stop:401 length:171 start_codon:yes stop_codon:yes gene_type:complete